MKEKIYERGTSRDKLIFDLLDCNPPRLLSTEREREEFQQFRSRVEPMTDEGVAEELRKATETIRAAVAPSAFSSGVGLSDFFKEHKDKKR